MYEIEVNKGVITFINIAILSGLPVFFAFHIRAIKKHAQWSFDWWQQVIIALLYIAAINTEVAAFWGSYKTYYGYSIVLPDSIYTLTTWQRWGRLLFYVILYLQTWVATMKLIPTSVKNTIG